MTELRPHERIRYWKETEWKARRNSVEEVQLVRNMNKTQFLKVKQKVVVASLSERKWGMERR
jgi:hypothetical protein